MKFRLLPIAICFGLVCFSLLMVYDASSAAALNTFNDKYYFLREQGKWALVGAFAFLVTSVVDYRFYQKLALPGLIGTLVLLLAVFIPGLGVHAYGASRWLDFGPLVIQPSELAKLALVIYLSAWLTKQEKGKLPAFLLLIGGIVTLIMLQPDMGTAIVLLFTALGVYFLSGNQILGLMFMFPLVGLGAVGLAIQSPYRLKRLLTFFNPDTDPLGASYHIRQAVIAIGSGGLFGLGLGNSRQKYSYLPEATTDSIFAIICEELGLLGALILISAFLILFYYAVRNTLAISDHFGRLLGMGIIIWLITQTFVNIGSIIALIPLTGVPLPFISYGGSALVMEMAGVGMLFNIWKNDR